MPIETTVTNNYICDKCGFSSPIQDAREGYGQGVLVDNQSGNSKGFFFCGDCTRDLFIYITN